MTVRLKLTLIYGGLFVAAGLLLITLSFSLIRIRGLDSPPRRPLVERVEGRADGQGNDDLEGRFERARQDERRTALRQVWRQSFLALAIMTVGAVAVGWALSGQMLSPIRRITAHARASSAATLDERIRLEGPQDELKELADTFDAMLDRLEAAFAAQQGFAAQASHELRTPLSIIRGEAELNAARPDIDQATRAASERILHAVDRSERLVDGLLALSRSESTMLEDARLDLADLMGDVVGEQVPAADGAGVRIELDLTAAPLDGDAALLRRLVANLVDNAIRYNLPGGVVEISLSTDDDRAELAVANTGPPMTDSDLETLFRPFARGDWARRNRTGFGLGLAIVRSVAVAHGGTVAAEARPGGGLVVRVRLPTA
jgi:signal transduction histidine kinase